MTKLFSHTLSELPDAITLTQVTYLATNEHFDIVGSISFFAFLLRVSKLIPLLCLHVK